MQAFKVGYRTGGNTAMITVLLDEGASLEEAVSKKDSNFRIGDPWSKITYHKVIPLSNVLVSELSVTELLALLKQS